MMEVFNHSEPHYTAKSIFCGALVIILGIVVYSNTLAHKAIDPIDAMRHNDATLELEKSLGIDDRSWDKWSDEDRIEQILNQ